MINFYDFKIKFFYKFFGMSLEKAIYKLLKHPKFYSRKYSTIINFLDDKIVNEEKFLWNIENEIQKKHPKEKINIFERDNVKYIGLESQRLLYKRDEKLKNKKFRRLQKFLSNLNK